MKILFTFVFIFISFFCALSQPLKPQQGANSKFGFVNQSGQYVVLPIYDDVKPFSENMAAVKKNSLWGFINHTGAEIIKPAYFSVQAFSEGKALVFNGKFGFIDKAGRLVIPMIYNSGVSFRGGTARVLKDGVWSHINHAGQTVPAPSNTAASKPTLSETAKFSLLFALDRRDNNSLQTNPSIDYIRSNGVLESIVNSLNTLFRLPQGVSITFKKINTPNAYYHPGEKRIYFGIEMINAIYTSLKGQYQGKQLLDYTTDAVVYILFHEIGHALIDIFNLPTSAGEEASADNFATYLFTRGNERLEQIALSGAQLFFNLSKNQKFLSATLLADEHLLNAQRAYIILCHLYGKNPQKYNHLVTSGVLAIDERRQNMCRYDYQKMVSSWDELLKPWKR